MGISWEYHGIDPFSFACSLVIFIDQGGKPIRGAVQFQGSSGNFTSGRDNPQQLQWFVMDYNGLQWI